MLISYNLINSRFKIRVLPEFQVRVSNFYRATRVRVQVLTKIVNCTRVRVQVRTRTRTYTRK